MGILTFLRRGPQGSGLKFTMKLALQWIRWRFGTSALRTEAESAWKEGCPRLLFQEAGCEASAYVVMARKMTRSFDYMACLCVCLCRSQNRCAAQKHYCKWNKLMWQCFNGINQLVYCEISANCATAHNSWLVVGRVEVVTCLSLSDRQTKTQTCSDYSDILTDAVRFRD